LISDLADELQPQNGAAIPPQSLVYYLHGSKNPIIVNQQYQTNQLRKDAKRKGMILIARQKFPFELEIPKEREKFIVVKLV